MLPDGNNNKNREQARDPRNTDTHIYIYQIVFFRAATKKQAREGRGWYGGGAGSTARSFFKRAGERERIDSRVVVCQPTASVKRNKQTNKQKLRYGMLAALPCARARELPCGCTYIHSTSTAVGWKITTPKRSPTHGPQHSRIIKSTDDTQKRVPYTLLQSCIVEHQPVCLRFCCCFGAANNITGCTLLFFFRHTKH